MEYDRCCRPSGRFTPEVFGFFIYFKGGIVVKELQLKYGCNPNQSKARIYSKIGELPIEVLNGRPGYINFRMPLTAGS